MFNVDLADLLIGCLECSLLVGVLGVQISCSRLRPWTHVFGASVICIACGTHSGKDEDASSRSQKSGGFKFSAPAIVADDEGDDMPFLEPISDNLFKADPDTLLAGVASQSNRGLAAHL